MKYAIQNNSGQWWTGKCWGVKQAREEYAENALPASVDVSNLDETQAEKIDGGECCDTFYCDPREQADDADVAMVHPIREAGDPL